MSDIQSASGPPQLLDRLTKATRAIGVSASIYTVTIADDGPDATSLSLFACHPALAQSQYHLGGLAKHPWLRCAADRSSPATASDVRNSSASDAEALDLARAYGFRSCLLVPTPCVADTARVEMLCVGSTRAGTFEDAGARTVRALARAMAAELHDWMDRYLSQRLREASGLQERDVKLLEFERQGFGTKEIALKTGMTPSSVDSHFWRLNARLDCPNRRASARRAAAYGLLEAK